MDPQTIKSDKSQEKEKIEEKISPNEKLKSDVLSYLQKKIRFVCLSL